jgi:hypothetical protein
MTAKGRTNPGSFSRPSPRSRIKSGMTDPGSMFPLFSRHPGRRPGVHVERLKVAGDIPVISGNSFRRLVPMNMDSPGSSPGQAQVKSGMTE